MIKSLLTEKNQLVQKMELKLISAVKIGYRHIDTAQAYGNEKGVGAGIKNCGISREDLFVTSKVAAEAKTYDAAAKSIDESLEKMGLQYIDLMLIHSPQPWDQREHSDHLMPTSSTSK